MPGCWPVRRATTADWIWRRRCRSCRRNIEKLLCFGSCRGCLMPKLQTRWTFLRVQWNRVFTGPARSCENTCGLTGHEANTWPTGPRPQVTKERIMDCKYRELLNAYHDGELRPDAIVELKLHLKSCQSCAAELAEISEVSQAFFCSLANPAKACETSPISASSAAHDWQLFKCSSSSTTASGRSSPS